MKKLITMAFTALLMLYAATAQAQIKFGVKGGLNVTRMSFDRAVFDESNQAGFYFGPTMKAGLPITGISITGALLYDQRSADIKVETNGGHGTKEKETLRQKQLALPVSLRYSLGIGDVANVFFFAGPQFGFNLADDMKNIDWRWKNTNLSVNLGAGITAFKHLEVSMDYNVGCGHTGEFSASSLYTGVKSKSGAYQIGLAYYF